MGFFRNSTPNFVYNLEVFEKSLKILISYFKMYKKPTQGKVEHSEAAIQYRDFRYQSDDVLLH